MFKNIFAAIGVVSLIIVVLLFSKIQPFVEKFDTFEDEAADTYIGFAEKLFESGSAVEAMVVKTKVEEGISAQDLDTSILSIANELNIKNVGELPLSKQVEAMSGKSYRHVKIYLLCNAMTAASMLNYNDSFSAFLPCRISVVEDKQGQLWLYAMNMDLMISGGTPIPPALKKEALVVKNTLDEIMKRAAEGDF